MSSLAEQLSNLTNPAPIFDDPEDVHDETSAKLLKPRECDEDIQKELTETTSIRRKSAGLLNESSERYSGRKVSRKNLADSDDGSGDESGEDDEDDDDASEDEDKVAGSEDEKEEEEGSEGEEEGGSEENDGDSEDDMLPESNQSSPAKKHSSVKQSSHKEPASEDDDEDDLNMDAESGDEEDSDASDSESGMSADDTDSEEGDASSDDAGAEAGEDGVRSFSAQDSSLEKQKGQATQAQLGLWDSLLKSRIELQKLVTMVNQLPQPAAWHGFMQAAGDDYKTLLHASQVHLKQVLDELVQLQNALLIQHPETKHILHDKPAAGPKRPADEVDSDEEILSDSDAEEEQESSGAASHKRIKMHEYPDFLAKRHKTFHEYRNNTIQKWHDKTRVASGKISKGFSAFEQSALKQIDQILCDRARLIQRTQLKRSVYRVLGSTEEMKPQAQDNDGPQTSASDSTKDYDEEIFDDGDFYHQLLRELIERKTNNISDPIALSRQWLEIQKLRNKVKRKVDTRASKGRKIRYDVHPKLVNFMAPCDSSSWTDEARNDLYSSLYGQRQNGTAT